MFIGEVYENCYLHIIMFNKSLIISSSAKHNNPLKLNALAVTPLFFLKPAILHPKALVYSTRLEIIIFSKA